TLAAHLLRRPEAPDQPAQPAETAIAQQTEPAAPSAPRRRLWSRAPKPSRDSWAWGRRPKNQGLLVEGGNIQVHNLNALKQPRVFVNSGAYDALPGRRLWLDKPVGPGFVTLWFSGNPEPVTDVAPVGFGAKMWGQQVGGKLTQLAMGAFEPPRNAWSLKAWMKWLLLGLVAAAGIAYITYRNGLWGT
ncbi:MAG: hypothetical protein ABR586_04175, partial [Thermoplasmatota archaeon]